MSLCSGKDQVKDRNVARVIGAAASKARTELGLSRVNIAQRIGVSEGFYSRIERGNSLPSIHTLLGMSQVLNVSADLLVGRGGDAPVEQGAWATLQPDDPPEMEAVANRLRSVTPRTLRLVSLLLKELEKAMVL